jgi:hypothetical protein
VPFTRNFATSPNHDRVGDTIHGRKWPARYTDSTRLCDDLMDYSIFFLIDFDWYSLLMHYDFFANDRPPDSDRTSLVPAPPPEGCLASVTRSTVCAHECHSLSPLQYWRLSISGRYLNSPTIHRKILMVIVPSSFSQFVHDFSIHKWTLIIAIHHSEFYWRLLENTMYWPAFSFPYDDVVTYTAARHKFNLIE